MGVRRKNEVIKLVRVTRDVISQTLTCCTSALLYEVQNCTGTEAPGFHASIILTCW